MKKLIFNPDYILKHDITRSQILVKNTIRTIREFGGMENFQSTIHPIQAMILSFINGKPVNEAIQEASQSLSISEKAISNFVLQLIENKDKLEVNLGTNGFMFPERTLIYVDKIPCDMYQYSPNDFIYEEIDFKTVRYNIPSTIALMLNNICVTNCHYCYADRRVKMNCKLPLKRIYELLREIKDLTIKGIDLAGGEIFKYQYWKEVMKEMRRLNLNHPYISTKIPIKSDTINFLKEIGHPDIQISLDTMIKDNLISILNVKDNYYDEIITTFKLLNKAKMPVFVHTILSSKNSNKEDIISVFNFIKQFDNIIHWKIDEANHSFYLNDWENIRSSNKKIQEVVNTLKFIELEENPKFELIYSKDDDSLDEEVSAFDQKWNDFSSRSICSGNLSSMFILPDGKVTICEELYWNPDFIIGDVNKSNIMDVWNSKRANELYYVKQENISPESACYKCDKFDECRKFKQICWREVIRAYGEDKKDFPDPNCPFAPKVEKDIYLAN